MKERLHPTQAERIPNEPHHQLLTEKLYSISEIAEFWPQSTAKLRRIFKNEPGVLVDYDPYSGKRPYKTLLVPKSVLNTALANRQNKPLQPLRPLGNPLPVMLPRHANRLVPQKLRKVVNKHPVR